MNDIEINSEKNYTRNDASVAGESSNQSFTENNDTSVASKNSNQSLYERDDTSVAGKNSNQYLYERNDTSVVGESSNQYLYERNDTHGGKSSNQFSTEKNDTCGAGKSSDQSSTEKNDTSVAGEISNQSFYMYKIALPKIHKYDLKELDDFSFIDSFIDIKNPTIFMYTKHYLKYIDIVTYAYAICILKDSLVSEKDINKIMLVAISLSDKFLHDISMYSKYVVSQLLSHNIVAHNELKILESLNYKIFVPVIDFIKVYIHVSSHVKIDVSSCRHWQIS